VPRSSLIIVVDRLGAGFLGAYGNTWLETPNLNGLAGESLLLENAFADSPSLDQVYRAYWSGRPAAARLTSGTERGLASELALAGIPAELITDDLEVADHPLAAGFDDKLVLPDAPPTGAASDAAETQFAALLAAAIDRFQDPTPRLIWLHARGLAAPWDAPLEFREQFRDEEDPESPTGLGPPEFPVTRQTDPDEILGWVHAYAGQVAAFDLCCGALLDAFRASPLHDDSLVVFTSPRGYPLGEHGKVGKGDDQLHEELLHVPWMVRRSDGQGALARELSLVQPADLAVTLRDWFGLAQHAPLGFGRSLLTLADTDTTADRTALLAVAPGQRAIRTSSWFFRQSSEKDVLYVKPDDRWEVNEVNRQCPKVVDGLAALADGLQRHLDSDGAVPLPPPDESLWRGVD